MSWHYIPANDACFGKLPSLEDVQHVTTYLEVMHVLEGGWVCGGARLTA